MEQVCCICLKLDGNLSSLNSEADRIEKLSFIAPELEWLEAFSICAVCNQQLNDAHSFRKLCFTNDSYRKNFSEKFRKSVLHTSITVSDKHDSDIKCKPENASDSEIESQKIVSTKEVFSCYHCKQNFHLKSALAYHISKCHSSKDKAIKCDKCSTNFRTAKALNTHNKSLHIPEKLPKFQCEKCEQQFKLLKDILKHCSIDHLMSQKDIKPYQCDKCLTRFASCSLLIQHKKYHNQERQFTCSMCGKSFITKRDLIGHEKLHNNERKYTCNECNKSFNTSQNLKTHIYVVHTDSSQWKYSCPICSKKFAMKANWKEHIKRHQETNVVWTRIYSKFMA
ncbi:zinc finger imprinted 3-like isoform X2 [Euwallacea similis]|uniref:zinc finger imprinted 3-like isoform X2 n=1 Tax=Euwallacea similis TaxID=1736056 RepID=UPI00344E1A2F